MVMVTLAYLSGRSTPRREAGNPGPPPNCWIPVEHRDMMQHLRKYVPYHENIGEGAGHHEADALQHPPPRQHVRMVLIFLLLVNLGPGVRVRGVPVGRRAVCLARAPCHGRVWNCGWLGGRDIRHGRHFLHTRHELHPKVPGSRKRHLGWRGGRWPVDVDLALQYHVADANPVARGSPRSVPSAARLKFS